MGDALFTPTAPSVKFTDTDDEVTFTATSPRVTFTTGPIVAAGSGVSALDDLSDVTLSSPSSGQVLKYNGTAWVNGTDSTGGAADVAYLRVGVLLDNPVTALSGSYNAGTDRWTVSALSTAPTTGDGRLLAVMGTDPDDMSATSTGLFEHIGSGVFARVRAWSTADAGTWVVSVFELAPGEGSAVAWLYLVGGATLGYSPLPEGADLTSLTSSVTTLQTRMGYLLPTSPVKPNLHVSKYVTFDPDFPLDGTATHVGGQAIEAGQSITILDNTGGNGGVWTLSLTGAATRATGFGSFPDEWIGQYDHVGYTGTRWAYFAVFRLYGDPDTRGMSPSGSRDGISGGEGVTRSYRPDLIATDLTGDNLTVLNADGTTTVVSIAAQTGTFCVLVTDTVDMVTISSGAVVQTEDFASADGTWIAQGWSGNGVGATVAVASGAVVQLSPTPAYTDEQARDALGTALTAGTGITITPNDGADTITVASSITQYTDEQVRDVMGTALVAGSNITITPNDGADTITIAATTSGSSGPFGGASSFGGNQGYHLPGVSYTALANAVALTANRIWYVPFMIRSGTLTVDRMHCEVTTGVAASNLRMGVYAADSTWQPTGAALIDVTATSATSGQSRNVTVSSVALTAGRYLACIVSDAAISVRSAAAINSWGSDHGATQVTSPSSAQVLTARYVNLTYPASLPNTGPAWTTVTATATPAAAGNDPVLLLRGTYS